MGQFPLIGGLAASAATLDNFKSSDKSPQNNADDRVQLDELSEEFSLPPSLPPSRNVTDPDDVHEFDCVELQQMSEDAPDMIEGSTLAWALERCDQGNIST